MKEQRQNTYSLNQYNNLEQLHKRNPQQVRDKRTNTLLCIVKKKKEKEKKKRETQFDSNNAVNGVVDKVRHQC